ncbi:ATP-dependent RNA helicase DBP3 [Grifola frondosa]|uniref:RNA helicase n=1 Tax=Grifola frondosa TaxID=5627 RepID=A0A1C7MRS8_GRIFR|nr:ATP-dependent RNA helicase DBP3 [Grifola frondosa]
MSHVTVTSINITCRTFLILKFQFPIYVSSLAISAMTMELHSEVPAKDASLKHKKSKKSREKKNAEKRDKEQEGDVGASHSVEEPEKKKKKKKHAAEVEDAAVEVGIAGSSMVVDSSAEPSGDTKLEKKRKRKRDAEESAIAESSSSKKEKKKRKDSSAEATLSEPISGATSSAPASAEIEAFLTKNEITLHVPQSAGSITPIISFDQLDVPSGLRSAFAGFKEPIPSKHAHGRLRWKALSGKTLAFGLPALARLISAGESKKQKGTTVSVLVMAPTRELAIQTHETLLALGEPFGIASVAVFGGVDKAPQIKTLKNANKDGKTTRIIVGTPGRILDLVNDGACDLTKVSYLVLDEADRMLDKGFENDIRSIIGHTKQGAERQTLMFSATWPEAVRRLAGSFQRDPVRVTVGSDDLTANSRVEQVVEVFDDARSKDSRLLGLLRTLSHKKSSGAGSPEDSRILVFVLYKKEATRVEGMLRSKGYTVGGLHGDLSQSARMEALQNFKTGVTGLLVATDVAARGLDIPNVAAVINYSFPLTIEDYIHRIGRTGRGGKSGKSITFFTGDNHERALAGELARVLRESGFEAEGLKKFPMTIKKKTHSAYGAFFRDDIPTPSGPIKITFD